jgi:predicted RNase H-like HicB family nuclease
MQVLNEPIVLGTKATGVASAYVPSLPIYAARDTRAKAERAIRYVLPEYLEAHPLDSYG